MEELNIEPIVSKNLSDIGIDLGILFNSCGNFSLVKLPNENWLCSMRVFGYYISSLTHSYLTTPELKLAKPDEQLFIELDGSFNLVRQFNLKRNTYYKHPIFNRETPYLEDGRLVKWNDELFFASAIFYQNNEHYEKFGMEIQNIKVNGEYVEAHHIWSSVEHGLEGRHKNWMAVPDMPFKYVIGTSETGAQTIDIQTGKIEDIGRFDIDNLYRGNTNLIECDGGYYTLTHRLSADELGRKKYLEYIVMFNRDLMPTRFSRPFKLTGSSIEFVTTMIEHDGKLMIGVTSMDDTPLILKFDKETLFNTIELK